MYVCRIVIGRTSDVTNLSQLSTTLRYLCSETEEVSERFISFTDVSADRTANGLLKYVKNIINKFNLNEKLIARTYDGAAVMVGLMLLPVRKYS